MTRFGLIRKENQLLYHNERQRIGSGKLDPRVLATSPVILGLCVPTLSSAVAPLSASNNRRSNGKTPAFYLTSAISVRSKSFSIPFVPAQLASSLTASLQSLTPLRTNTPIRAWARAEAGKRDQRCHRVTNSPSRAQKRSHLTLIMWTDKGRDKDLRRKSSVLF